VVTPADRFAVDYTLRRTATGWRATDIRVEGVSLAQNFRAQFDAAVAKDSFQGLLDRLRAKVSGPSA
jgi:phospholipid transport system substrate-binding protein